jgi:TonB family protein
LVHNSARFVRKAYDSLVSGELGDSFNMMSFAPGAFQGTAKCVERSVAALAAVFFVGTSLAQTPAPAKPDGSTSDIKTPFLDNYTPSEEVKRRALGPLRIIKQLGDQKKPAVPATPTPAPTPVSVAPKPKVEEKPEKTPEPVVAKAVEVPVIAPLIAPVVSPAPAPEIVKVAKKVNNELIPVSQDPPVFNRNLMRDTPHALVKVAFDVKPDGSTSGMEVTASNNRRLNSSAMDAVSRWKFKPIDETVRVEIELAFSSD